MSRINLILSLLHTSVHPTAGGQENRIFVFSDVLTVQPWNYFCRRFLCITLRIAWTNLPQIIARSISRISQSEQHVRVRNCDRKWLLRYEKRISVPTTFKLYFSLFDAGIGRTHVWLPCKSSSQRWKYEVSCFPCWNTIEVVKAA